MDPTFDTVDTEFIVVASPFPVSLEQEFPDPVLSASHGMYLPLNMEGHVLRNRSPEFKLSLAGCVETSKIITIIGEGLIKDRFTNDFSVVKKRRRSSFITNTIFFSKF